MCLKNYATTNNKPINEEANKKKLHIITKCENFTVFRDSYVIMNW